MALLDLNPKDGVVAEFAAHELEFLRDLIRDANDVILESVCGPIPHMTTELAHKLEARLDFMLVE